MRTRINYTGRDRIFRRDVHISVDSRTDSELKCSVNLRLDNYSFPLECPVVVECYHGPQYMRLPFGTVGEVPANSVLDLSEFASAPKVLFRVKVLDFDDHGKLLGLADQVPLTRPDVGESGRSLVAVQPYDIGQRVWRLGFDDEEGRPVLYINNQIEDWREFTGPSSVVFQSSVLPEVFSQILQRVLIEEGNDFDPNSDDWRDSFVKMAQDVGGRPYDSQARANPESKREWIETIVDVFAERHSFANQLVRSRSE